MGEPGLAGAGRRARADRRIIVAAPDIGFTTLALLAGIGFVPNGVGMCAIGLSMRGTERELSKPLDPVVAKLLSAAGSA